MASLNGFNAAEVNPAIGFDPLPAGRYLAQIVNSEMKPTAAGTGEYLKLEFQVLDEQYKNRKLFANLNLNNPSDMAVGIARAELSAICRAVGVLVPKNSEELHGIPLTLKVGLKKRTDTDELENVIRGYEPRASVAAAQPVAAGAASTPPWQKKVK